MRTSNGAFLCGILVSATLIDTGAYAKRLGPKEVAPLVAAGVRYKVPHFGASHDQPQNGGYVQAWHIKTNKLLWDRMVYRIQYDRSREGDVQDVFITRIRLKRKVLLVMNERSEEFEMDLATGNVRALTPLGPGRELPIPSDNAATPANMATDDLTFLGTVVGIKTANTNGPVKNWVVTARVDRVLSGAFAGGQLSFSIHSPAQTGLKRGRQYRIRATRTQEGYVVDERQWMQPP